MRRHLDSICGACSAGVSVVCMSSMAAALAAAGGATAAGAAGMGGMGGMDPSGGAGSVLPALLERLGLGFLSTLPNEVLQPLLLVLLAATVGSAYLAYRGHGRPGALATSAASAIALYAGIYVWMSDALYLAGLAGLVIASVRGIALTRAPHVGTR